MNSKLTKILASLALVTILAIAITACVPAASVSADTVERGGGGGGGRGAGGGAGQGSGTVPATPLSDAEKTVLNKAILEEYGALNLYNSVIAKFGSVVPFASIASSEQQHINALTRQATKYGVAVPANPGLANPPAFATLAEACSAGAAAEIADAALYDQLKPTVTHTDILNVFNNLQSASLNNHLPQFNACK
jgi:hypothetical protein